MSLFRPESLFIGLEPQRASIVRVSERRRPRVLADALLALHLDSHAPRLDALFERLGAPDLKARNVRFTLADTLVRYFVTDAPAGLRSTSELKDVIAARFEEQFGLAAAHWIISSDLQPGSSSYLACAAPRTLIEALRAGCADTGLRLRTITPFTVSEMNRWRRRLPRQSFWFATASAGIVTLCYRAKAGWRGIRTHAQGDASPAPLLHLAQRDALRLGVEDLPAIRCSGIVGQPVSQAAMEGVDRLGAGLWPGQGEAWSRDHRLALSCVWP